MIVYNKNGVVLREATAFDIEPVARNMRPEDVQEVLASDGQEPLDVLLECFDLSPFCFTLLYKEEPIAMFGVVPMDMVGEKGVIWLLGTDGIKRIQKTFVRLTCMVVKEFLEIYPVLINYVDDRYETSKRWLKRCGAHFFPPEPFGALNLPFVPFEFRRAYG